MGRVNYVRISLRFFRKGLWMCVLLSYLANIVTIQTTMNIPSKIYMKRMLSNDVNVYTKKLLPLEPNRQENDISQIIVKTSMESPNPKCKKKCGKNNNGLICSDERIPYCSLDGLCTNLLKPGKYDV